MSDYRVTFEYVDPVLVPSGALLTEAAVRAGVQIAQPCGGQGRCGRCAVRVQNGGVRRRSENRTVLPRLRAASDTTSSGRSWPGRNVMQESVSCRPNKRRRSRSRIWLPMKVSFISGGRAQATAPRRSHPSTKGHCPTLAGM